MEPSATPQTSPKLESNAIDNTVQEIRIHKSRARTIGFIMGAIFIVLISSTIVLLWYFESRERGSPDIQNEAKQFVDEVKKEFN